MPKRVFSLRFTKIEWVYVALLEFKILPQLSLAKSRVSSIYIAVLELCNYLGFNILQYVYLSNETFRLSTYCWSLLGLLLALHYISCYLLKRPAFLTPLPPDIIVAIFQTIILPSLLHCSPNFILLFISKSGSGNTDQGRD